MNVKVETDTLKSGSNKIKGYFTEHDELFNKINNLPTESCASLANFKSALVNKFNEYNKHQSIISDKLIECAENLVSVDNLIASNVTTLLPDASNFEFTSIDSLAELYETNNIITNDSDLKGVILNSTSANSLLNMEPGVQILEYTLSSGKTMKYAVRVPENATENMPVIFWVHGDGERNKPQIVSGLGPIKAAEELNENRFIIIQPVIVDYLMSNQYNDELSKLDSFIDEVQSVYKFDTDRIILSGFSMGGAGTWYLGNESPDKYAGISPASYNPYCQNGSVDIENLKNSNLPIYAMAGGAESFAGTNENILEEFKDVNPNRDLSAVPVKNLTHYNFDDEGYTQDFFDWCFKQNRKNN